jgi:methylmalonyl-CoA/ethylmalonyl-CoA epimerase
MAEIDHLGIAVRSLDAAKKFYEKLGLRVVGEEVVEHERVRVAMVPVGESRIELLEPTQEDSPVGRFLSKRGEGLHHVALRVDDLAATVERLKQDGTRMISDEIKVGAGGHLYVFVHPTSTGGVLLELCEDPPQGV